MMNYQRIDLANLTMWLEVVPDLVAGIACAEEMTRRARAGELNTKDKHCALEALATRREKTISLSLSPEHPIFSVLAELQAALEAISDETAEQLLRRRIENNLSYIDMPDHDLRQDAIRTLIATGNPAIPFMIEYARVHERGWRVLMVLDAVADIGTPDAVAALQAFGNEKTRAASHAANLASKLAQNSAS